MLDRISGKKLELEQRTFVEKDQKIPILELHSVLTRDINKEMVPFESSSFDEERPMADPISVASIIIGGGAGTRLFLLTSRRAKPVVPIGGCYRLIDVPMSNCINSGIRKIFILTQFNSFKQLCPCNAPQTSATHQLDIWTFPS